MRSVSSASLARNVPTATVFSATENSAGLWNAGPSAGVPAVRARTVPDQSPAPKPLLARTRTSYTVPAARPVTVAPVAVPAWGQSTKAD